MLDKYTLRIIKPSTRLIAKQFIKYDVTANKVTLFGFILGIIAVIFISYEFYITGLILILTNRLFDGVDGEIARISNTDSPAGAFLDIVFDFIMYQAVLVGFSFANIANTNAAIFLMLCFTGTGVSFLTFAIYAEKFNLKSINFPNKGFYYLDGLAEGTETIIFFILICLLPEYFQLLAFIFALICIQTTVVRIFYGYKTIKTQTNTL